ncbi:hybrid sensor histidine kinase/response regulator [Nitrosomonas ureae]|uniref:histidine kinase n=1 Tax=Nitrosomonas ureae TaxID=44577 RepID=A0A1H5VU31_9PROT|nr:PAS domain S-box protein [Nitrosomonas ureae]SEF90782.1 two-component system, NarL family, sensor histidine kinase UhpB [Nitrosomonas ureae]
MIIPKIHILLIEDNETDAILVESDLQQAMGDQMTVTHVERLSSAIELIHKKSFDLILSDLTLPDSDGITTIKQLREHTVSTSIAALSFKDDEKLAIKAIKAGAQDYLVKGSLTEDVLARVIRYSIERQRIEESNRKAQKRFQTIFEKAPLGIALVNLHTGRCCDVNPKYASIVGRHVDELIGTNHADIIHPDDLQSYHDDIENFLNRGLVDCKIEKRILHQDISVIWIKISIVPFEAVASNEICYLYMIEDITERKQMIENSHQSAARLQDIREEERTRIGREIHDVLGGALTVLKMDLDWLSKKITAEPMHERIRLLHQLTSEAIETARRVSVSLRPNVLDNLGLLGAIEWLVRELEQRTKIDCTLESTISNLSCHNKSYETAIFRIIQEVFINIIRHSNATKVDIELVENKDSVVITIKDNGIGITKLQILNPQSFGIISMNERTQQFGGKFEISGISSQGSVVMLRIPLTLVACAEESIDG